MRKKWTYVAVACMLLGTAPVFTGCIDTDEPAGLEDLRGAKSELLRAKAAVEAAKVAEVQAQAALLQAQAKVEEANAVKVQAEAEKIKAEAAIAQAKADYINAKTEEAKAEAQAVIDENNRIQAEWEANAAVRQAEAEAAIKQAQLATAEALAKYQTVVAALQDTKNKALDPYITALNQATTQYYKALDNLRIAQRAYNQQAADNEEAENNWDLNTRDLQREVKVQTRAYEGAVAALDRVNEEIKEAENLKPSDLAVKYNEVLDEQSKLLKEVADLRVQAAEQMVEIYNTQKIPLDNLKKEIDELKAEPQEIAAVEFDFSGDGSGYPKYVQRGVYELEKTDYSMNNLASYFERKEDLEFWVKEFKSWTRDANSNAWTNDHIANLEGQIKAKEEVIKKLKASWQEAINAYKVGAYAQTDPSKITGYTGVTTALTAYNAAAKALNEANATYANLVAQKEKDYKAWQAIVAADGSANTAWTAAKKAIDEKYSKIDPADEYLKRFTALTEELKTAEEALQKADEALKNADVSDNEAWNAAYEAQRKAEYYRNQVKNKLAECTPENVKMEIDLEKEEEEEAAKKVYDDAITAANKAYNDKWAADKGTEYAKLEPAMQSIKDAKDGFSKALVSLTDASAVYNKAVSEIDAPIDINGIYALAQGVVDEKLGYEVRKADVAPSDIIILEKDDMEKVIKLRSEVLFGQGYGSNVYGDNIARLTEMTDAEILAKVDEAMDELAAKEIDITFYHYINECNKYGAAGARLALKEEVRIAKSWLTNADLVNAKIKQAETALKALTDSYDALEAEIEKKQEEYDLAYKKMDADMKDTMLPAEAKEAELEPLQSLLDAIQHAIYDYLMAGDITYGEESGNMIVGIDDYKKQLEERKKDLELAVFDAETLLKKAQDRLNNWNSESISWLEVLAQKVEDKQIIVDRKKAKLDQIQAALDAVIAALTNDPTATVETPSTDTPATEE